MLKFHLLSCRVRAKAKVCVAMAWKMSSCTPSDVVKGIFDKVIGEFNPFCTGDRDPWSTKINSCAPYRIPYRDPVCQDCNCNTLHWSGGDWRGVQKGGAQITHDLAFLSLSYIVRLAAILLFDYLII